VAALFMLSILAACGDDNNNKKDDDEGPTLNIGETLEADDESRFTTLLAAIEAAELSDDLAGAGPFTVFAPTNAAFDLLPEGALDDLLLPANQALLIDIVGFHAYSGELRAADVIALGGTAATMLNDKDLRIDIIDGSVILSFEGNREALVIETDILATNGVIHVIDAVLDPEDATTDIVQTAVDNGFNTLVTAVTAADLVDELQGPGPLTVFAPTDAAFAALPAGVLDDLLLPANQADLIDLLLYHVYDGSVLAADAIALDGMNVGMFNAALMSIDVVGADVVLNLGGNRAATVTLTNVLCSNGTIHVIDAVLDTGDAPAP
jgi:uncharacterized surface protein with fasciclin (FAS1) repeats